MTDLTKNQRILYDCIMLDIQDAQRHGSLTYWNIETVLTRIRDLVEQSKKSLFDDYSPVLFEAQQYLIGFIARDIQRMYIFHDMTRDEVLKTILKAKNTIEMMRRFSPPGRRL